MKRLKEEVTNVNVKHTGKKEKSGKAKELCSEETEGFTLGGL